jgi:hypothetical protein
MHLEPAGLELDLCIRHGGRSWRTSLRLVDGAKGWWDFGIIIAVQRFAAEVPAIGSCPYLTRDGGRPWHRIRSLALRVPSRILGRLATRAGHAATSPCGAAGSWIPARPNR